MRVAQPAELMAAEPVPATEADLVARLRARHVPGQSRLGSWSVQPEVPIARSVADLVFVHAVEMAYPLRLRPLSVRECVVLAVLRRRGPTRVDHVEAACGVVRGTLWSSELAALAELGLIRLGAGGRVALDGYSPARAQVICVEAKLLRWREGVTQALACRRFADRVYLAVPPRTALRIARHSVTFRQTGVGLLAVGEQHNTLLVEAAPSSEHDWTREYFLSRWSRRARSRSDS